MRRVLFISGLALWLLSCGNSGHQNGHADSAATGGNATGAGGAVNTGRDPYGGTENGAGTGTGTGTGAASAGGTTTGEKAGTGGAGTTGNDTSRGNVNRQQ